MPSAPSAREIRSLTGLRGIAALYVVSYHHRIGVPFSNPVTTFLAHGYLAVDLFFILSGFVMALTYGHLFERGFTKPAFSTFLGRRIARIYPLYIIVTLAGLCLVIIGCLDAPKPLSLGPALVLNILMVQAWGFVGSFDGPGWSISAEWAAYLLFPALIIVVKNGNALARWSAAFACVGVLACLCELPAHLAHHANPEKLLDIYGPDLGLPVLRCLSEFTLGLLAYRVFDTPARIALGAHRWLPIAVSLIALALLSLPWTDLAIVMLFPILILSVASGNSIPARLLASPPLRLVGILSYSIYLTHELVNASVQWAFMSHDRMRIMAMHLDASMLTVILTLPVALLAYVTIEAPGRRWLRRLLEPLTVPATRK